jgi:hypothetical protein
VVFPAPVPKKWQRNGKEMAKKWQRNGKKWQRNWVNDQNIKEDV